MKYLKGVILAVALFGATAMAIDLVIMPLQDVPTIYLNITGIICGIIGGIVEFD